MDDDIDLIHNTAVFGKHKKRESGGSFRTSDTMVKNAPAVRGTVGAAIFMS